MTNNHPLKSSENILPTVGTSGIIAVGASAGGLEALKAFFRNLGDEDINTYVVIQHLSPDYKSMMGELLAKSTSLIIEQIKDNMEILPGKIYLIPPVNNLVIQNGMLHLLDKPKKQKLNLPIDMFLQSPAEYKTEEGIAVILSGTGSDGSRGIRAIKEREGMVMVQDPNEAKFDGMPKSDIHTGLVDYAKVEKATLDSKTNEYIEELEIELKKIKEELRSSLEVVETRNEELQAANEELLASNEQLQSTNEELRSVNGEINTVNAENVQKMDDLAELNADMNNLLESIDIGTIFLDNSLRIRKFTPNIKKHFSLISTDVGRPIENFTNSFGTNKGKKRLVESCKKVLETGNKLERAIISREGHHYLQRISPFINSNQIIEGVVITFVDIETLLKAQEDLIISERKFKSFYEKDPILHFSVDPNSTLIIECNGKAVEKLGYISKDELIGRPMHELFDDQSQLHAVKLNKLFQQSGELNNIEKELVTKDGEKLPFIISSTVEVDGENNIISNRFTCVDISQFRQALDRLKDKKADLERANKDLEQFVSICSHDLQEPLATIKFGSDILGKIYGNQLDAKGREYISYIDAASDRLSNQLKALLEHSRIGRNTDKTIVNTKELVEIVKYDLAKRIRDTGAKIHVGALPKIKAYQVELRLLFQNLISNSLKYIADDRTPEIKISSFPENNYWVFSIMDNGIGISSEDQKNIFTIFSRVRNKKYEGTGVGLAHAEKIVHLHEGSIWVDSQLGVGSTFYFKIKTD